MFENIGSKIKNLSKFICCIEIIACIVVGIVMAAINENLIFAGILVAVIGALLSWVGAFILYGFCQLIESSDIIAEESRRSNAKYENNIRKERDRKEKQKIAAIKANLSDDDFGSDEYIYFDCPNCKYTLSYTKEEILSNNTLACPMCNCEMNVKSILK